MKIKFSVNFKECHLASKINKAVSKKKNPINMPFLIRRQSVLRKLLLKIHLIYTSQQLPKILNITYAYSFRNEQKMLSRCNCLLSNYISSVPINFRISPKISFSNSAIIPIQNFSLFIPEQLFQNLLNEYKSIKVRFKRLKDDISVFQKNLSIKEEKIRYGIKNQSLKKLIRALDELERAKNFNTGQIKSKKLKLYSESFCKNLQMVYNSFITDTGLTVITPSIDDPFNERFQTIIGIVYKKGEKDNSIVEVVKSGYAFNGEILSHSQVIISTNNIKHPNLTSKQDISRKNGLISRLRRKIFRKSLEF